MKISLAQLLLIILSFFLFITAFALAEETDYYAELGIVKIKDRIVAPDFTITSLDGREVSLSDMKGKVVFLNFWATWCGPCRSEVRDIQKLYESLKHKDFTVMAIDIREDAATVKKFMKKNSINFPVYIDRTGEIAMRYSVRGIPTTYIINPEGEVVGVAIGPREWASKSSIRLMESLGNKKAK